MVVSCDTLSASIRKTWGEGGGGVLKFKLLLEQKKGISLSYVVFVLFPSEGVDSYNDPVLSGLHTHLL